MFSVHNAKVKEFCSLVEDIPDKNAGGCLIMCYSFWKWAGDETFCIVQHNRWGDGLKNNRAWIKGELDEASSDNHFSWKYRGEQYDSLGRCSGGEELWELNELGLIDKFCLSAINNSSWNYAFDRATAIPELEDLLGIDLSEIEWELADV